MSIKNALIASDSPFFSGAHAHMRRDDLNILKHLIMYLADKGVFVEIEQIIDCVTNQFPRTSNRDFDIVIVHSNRPLKGTWSELEISLAHKVKNEGKIVQYLDTDREIEEIFSGPTYARNNSSGVVELLLSELESSMCDGNDLRSEMLVKLLISIDELAIQSVIEALDHQPNPLMLALRIQSIFEEAGFFNSDSMEKIEAKLGLDENTSLAKIAILASEKPLSEIVELVNNSVDKNNLSRELFMNSKNTFLAFFFLSMYSLHHNRINSNGKRDLMQKNWADDLDVLSHWTKIEPANYDSWQIRTRALWNNKKIIECGKVAEEALILHPGEHNLLRRMAHGFREAGNHLGAIEIELTILKEEGLSRIDNYIYLSRSYFALEDWENARNFIEMALSINPEHPEMLRKLDIVASKNYP